MDVMSLRRGLMMGMASGAQFVKGTFTTPDSGSSYTLSFGKTFSKYLYYIEMTDDSKTSLHNSGQTAARMYACLGRYPRNTFNGNNAPLAYVSYRVVPSTDEISLSTSAAPNAIDETTILFGMGALTGGANTIYRGYSYNYYVVEIK